MLAVWKKGKKKEAPSEPQAPSPKTEWNEKLGAKAEGEKPLTPALTPENSEMRRDIIPERYLPQETKEKTEISTIEEYGDREQILYEHRWSKTAKEDITEIESKIDSMFRGIPEKPKERHAATREEKMRFEQPSFAPIPSSAPPSWVDLPITGTIIDRRVLYRSAGGYIIEVVYRAPDGILKTDKFSVTSVGDVEYTLDKLRQNVPPVPHTPIQPQPVVAQEMPLKTPAPVQLQAPEEKKAEKKGRKGLAMPPLPLFGKKKPSSPEEKKPEEPKAEQSAAMQEQAPAEKKKGLDIGGIIRKLQFGKKKQQ